MKTGTSVPVFISGPRFAHDRAPPHTTADGAACQAGLRHLFATAAATCKISHAANGWRKGTSLKFTQDALLNAAATIVAARLQAQVMSKSANGAGAPRSIGAEDSVSHMLLQAMTEVLEGTELMEEHAKNNLDLWSRVGSE